MNATIRMLLGRIVYALILWVVAFSTLEQFSGLNEDLRCLDRWIFHALAGGLALVSAVYEAVTLNGLEGLRSVWDRPEPIADVATRDCRYGVALSDDLKDVRKLAKKRYGWALAPAELRRWHDSNPNCMYLMRSDGELVGYLDAFPISAADYAVLLGGGSESGITPLKPEAVDATCSFYIASVVLADGWGGMLPTLLKKAITFYGRVYASKIWVRVCAVGYSLQGRRLLEKKQAKRVPSTEPDVHMYVVERDMLPAIGRANRAVWGKLLPPLPPPPPTSTP